MVHIAGRRMRERPAQVEIKIYSNLEAVTLSVNGRELPAVTGVQRLFLWKDVALAPGANLVVATASGGGHVAIDRVSWTSP
jgi:beta-galactosidase